MQATKLNDLRICSDKPPCTQAGIAWQAVQEIKTPDTRRKKREQEFVVLFTKLEYIKYQQF